MTTDKNQSNAPGWDEKQAEALRAAIDARRASRRSFLRSGVLSTVALGTVLVLTPQEARAQGSGY